MQMTRRQWTIWRYIDSQVRRQANAVMGGIKNSEQVFFVVDSDVKMMLSIGVIKQVCNLPVEQGSRITVRFTPLGKKPHGLCREHAAVVKHNSKNPTV